MSEDFVKAHQARQIARSIVALEDSPSFHKQPVDERQKYADSRDRVFAFARAVEALFEKATSLLASKNGLAQLQSHLQNALTEVTAFTSNGAAGHVINASGHVDQALQYLWAFGPQLERLGTQTLADLYDSQARTAERFIDQLSQQRDDLHKRLEEAIVETEKLKDQLTSIETAATKERAEAGATVARLEQQFAKEETSRASMFLDKLNDIETKGLDLHAYATDESKRLLAQLEVKRSEAEKIVQVVGNIGVTGNYQRIANSESADANLWRWITLAIFAAGITLAGLTFWKFWHEPSTTENVWSIAIRLLFAIAITAPAFYTARESARHRTNADRARKLELELASLGPFIELLPEDLKHQIREKLTPVYFGNSVVEPHTPGSLVDPSLLKDLVVDVVKAVKK